MKKLSRCLFALGAAAFSVGLTAPESSLISNGLSDDPHSGPADQNARPLNANAHYLDVPNSKLVELLDDPQRRMPKQFQVPPELKPIVAFWLKIYAKYSLYQTLVYDRDHHDVIYEVVDSRELFQKGLSPVALEITTQNLIRKKIAAYRGALRRLQRNPRAVFKIGTAGAHLLRIWGKRSSSQWRHIEEAMRIQRGQRDKIMDGLINADPFFPAMEAIFRKFGVPVEITRLPLVESSFNLQARSKVAAVGVWQFLEKSATEYLVVDSKHKIDERLSPIKSTYAAARMFKRNYALLHDWGLAIIAYNHGARNLIPIKGHYQGDQIAKLLKQTKKTPLGYASRSFYAEFLAVLHAERYRDVIYGLQPQQHPDAISIVKMKKPVSVFEIASYYNISIHELRRFNPDIFDLSHKLPAGTRVVLPRKHGESLVAAPQPEPTVDSYDDKEKSGRGIASDFEFLESIE